MGTPAAAGSCFTLNVGSTADSEFNIVTANLAGVAVFAQHVPIEFERTRHYFYDAAGTDIEPIAESAAFEWSGVFSLDGMTSPCKWSMQAGDDGEYPDPSMAIVIIPTDTPDEDTMNSLASDAVGLLGLFGTSCTEVEDGDMMTPSAEGSCYILNVGNGADTEFDIDTVGIDGVAVYAQHIPVEFERDRHYFYDAVATDIEPIAESDHDVAHSHGHAEEEAQAFEWAGVFSLDGMTSPSKWSMQAGEDGTYPDQSMKVVIIPTDTPDEETMVSMEIAANELVAGDCPAVADLGSLTPAAEGSCFTLTVGDSPDSEFNIVTDGIQGVAVFAEHVPIEFERTRHYFYDADATDIEPIAESAAFEWAGVFSLDGMTSPCKWSMQAGDDGQYPD